MWEIRAILPQALAVEVLAADGDAALAAMERRHEAGFFVATLRSSERPWYRLRIMTPYGTSARYDPYSFGPILDDEQLSSARDVGSEAHYRVLGAHRVTVGAVEGFLFAVWAPSARRVSLVGDFNDWDGRVNPMRLRHGFGDLGAVRPGSAAGRALQVRGQGPARRVAAAAGGSGRLRVRARRPRRHRCCTASSSMPGATPAGWRAARARPAQGADIDLRMPSRLVGARADEGNRYLTYRELAERLIPYVKDLGFTHIELLPITEFPFDGSWGYQPVSLFAPTSRFGTPEDFAAFVEAAHEAGIGIILDWVPGHFPNDPHGLGLFDGTHLYEHADPRQGFHQDWGTYIYNYGRQEVDGVPGGQCPLLARALPSRWAARRCGRLDALSRLLAAAPANGFRTGTAATRTWRRSISFDA